MSQSSLLVVTGEPLREDHVELILTRVIEGFTSWNGQAAGVTLNTELLNLINANLKPIHPSADETVIRYQGPLAVTLLFNPTAATLSAALKSFLTDPVSQYRHLIHAGPAVQGTGSWLLQDDTFSFHDLARLIWAGDVQTAIHSLPYKLVIDCFPEGEFNDAGVKLHQLHTGGLDITVGHQADLDSQDNLDLSFAGNLRAYLGSYVRYQSLDTILPAGRVVGHLNFARPTFYVFPAGQGDAALFGVNGYTIMLDGGHQRKPGFWPFLRHIDRLDAMLVTSLHGSNFMGPSSVLRRIASSKSNPRLMYAFMNCAERKPGKDGHKHGLLMNLYEEGHNMKASLTEMGIRPMQINSLPVSAKSPPPEPILLFQRLGYGKLEMYVLNPQRDSKELKDFLTHWENVKAGGNGNLNVSVKTPGKMPVPLSSLSSLAVLLVWHPFDPEEPLTRLVFPGSCPQDKVLQGLEKLKSLEFLRHPSCSAASLKSSRGIEIKPKPSTTKLPMMTKGHDGASKKAPTPPPPVVVASAVTDIMSKPVNHSTPTEPEVNDTEPASPDHVAEISPIAEPPAHHEFETPADIPVPMAAIVPAMMDEICEAPKLSSHQVEQADGSPQSPEGEMNNSPSFQMQEPPRPTIEDLPPPKLPSPVSPPKMISDYSPTIQSPCNNQQSPGQIFDSPQEVGGPELVHLVDGPLSPGSQQPLASETALHDFNIATKLVEGTIFSPQAEQVPEYVTEQEMNNHPNQVPASPNVSPTLVDSRPVNPASDFEYSAYDNQGYIDGQLSPRVDPTQPATDSIPDREFTNGNSQPDLLMMEPESAHMLSPALSPTTTDKLPVAPPLSPPHQNCFPVVPEPAPASLSPQFGAHGDFVPDDVNMALVSPMANEIALSPDLEELKKNWGDPMALPPAPPSKAPTVAGASARGSSASGRSANNNNNTAKLPGAKLGTAAATGGPRTPRGGAATGSARSSITAATSASQKAATGTSAKKTPVASATAKSAASRSSAVATGARSTSTGTANRAASSATKPAAPAKPATARPSIAATKGKPSGTAPRRPMTSSAASAAAATPAFVPSAPIFVDLAYIPNGGNPNYVDVDYFRWLRAKYYVLSALNPTRPVLDALMSGKKLWKKKDEEVVIIPTYDTDTVQFWMALNKDSMQEEHVEIAPPAVRCTLNLQDHETSCAAYRLEF